MRGFIAWMKDWISSRDLARSTSAAPDLRAAPNRRAQAYAELRDAENRGDARDIGKCRMRLAQATHDELSQQVWG